MTLSHVIAHEWRTRLSRPAALLAFALFAGALIVGAVNGRAHCAARLRAIAAHRAEVADAMATWLRDRKAIEMGQRGVPPSAGSAMDVTFATYLAPAPLADFAIGQSDLLPQFGAVSLWSPDVRLFSRYEIGDPVSLSLGAFDIGKAILLVLPLLLIVLSFDILSAERDAGRLGLLLAQGASPRRLLWPRLLIRSGAALTLTTLVALAALVAPGGPASLVERLPFFALWAACVFLYGAFWIGMIALVAAGSRRGEVQILLLLLTWAGLAVVFPAVALAGAESFDPAPSRLQHLARARTVEIETERAEVDVAAAFAAEHPELAIDTASDIPAYVRTAFLVTTAVDRATGPIQAAFDRSAADREETLTRLRWVSPAAVVHQLFNDIAGTSSARHRRYAAAARQLKAAYAERAGPFIVAGRRLPLDEAASLPAFHLGDEGAAALFRRRAAALGGLALAAAALLLLAARRVRRASGV
jgi:ABC-2 type transport system permease protein